MADEFKVICQNKQKTYGTNKEWKSSLSQFYSWQEEEIS